MVTRLPPLNALRTFEVIARHLSITKAAHELHVTHAAVSQQLKQLENYLEISLVERHGKRISLTDIGKTYATALNLAFANIQQATENLFNKNDNVLTISIPTTLTLRWFISRLHSFQSLHPDIEIRMSTSELGVDLMRGTIDLAIHYGNENDWPELHKDFLLHDYLFPVCSSRLLDGSKKIDLHKDIQRYKLIYVSAELRSEDWSSWLKAAKIPEPPKSACLYFQTTMQALQAAQSGLGLAIAHELLVSDDLQSQQLIAPFSLKVKTAKNYYLVCPERTLRKKKVKVFRKWLLNEFKNLQTS